MNKIINQLELNNFKELIDYSTKKYKNNVAYKYKTSDKQKIIEKTYKNVGDDVRAFSNALLVRGLNDKRIAIIGSNRYEWVISYFSLEYSGIVAAPMDKMLNPIEIESLIKRSLVNAVIFEKSNLEIFKKLKNDVNNHLDTLICMDNIEDDEVVNFNTLLNEGYNLINKNDIQYNNIKIDNEKMAIMLFTSGTTDKSKIVMLSQKNILSNICVYKNHFKMLQKDTLLSILPIHHTFECSITIIYGFYCGATVAFSDGLRYLSNNLKEYKVTIFVAVPLLIENMYKKIKKEIENQGKIEFVNKLIKISNLLLKFKIDIRRLLFKSIINNIGPKLRIMLYGAASMDKEAIEGFHNLGLDSIQGYGLTETSPVITAESIKKHCFGSAGFPLDNIKIKIHNPNNDGIGEILVNGPNVFLGYYDNKEKTKEAFIDGWFNTGDLGYIDEKGFLFITGRQKDVIVLSNGKNVYPEELETLINRIPYIKESMVFLRNNSKNDNTLVAKIVYDKDEMRRYFPNENISNYQNLIWDDIKNINKDLVLYKNIKQILITDIELEKTTTQKIKRFKEISRINQKYNSHNNTNALPENELEEKILQCIQEVLNNKEINVERDFFEAGGDSLSAIELQIKLSNQNIDLNTQEIFDNPSAREMAKNVLKKEELNGTENYMQVDIKSKNVQIKEKSNVLLTGSTGFLGIHILNELLKKTNNDIYCLIRETNNTIPEEKLIKKYQYYFENEDLMQFVNKRVFIIKGDLIKSNFNIDEKEYHELTKKIDIIINVAADVSHYGNRQYSYEANVVSTKNIIKFAKESNSLVNHISTIGLAGNNLVNTNECIKDSFSENDLIIGQKYNENVYLSTKLEAEKLIINEIKNNKICANILRVGNLMNRYSDNLFQDNKNSNAFQNKIKEIIKIKSVPKEIVNFSFDLTPVDLCAEAVVKLVLYYKYNNVYHVLNNYEVEFNDIMKILDKMHIKINVVELNDLQKENIESKWLINDFLLKNKRKIKIDSNKTIELLNTLGFEWNISKQYYINVFKSLINI